MGLIFTDNFSKMVQVNSLLQNSKSPAGQCYGTYHDLNGNEQTFKSAKSNNGGAFNSFGSFSIIKDVGYYSNSYTYFYQSDFIVFGTGTPGQYALGAPITRASLSKYIEETSTTTNVNNMTFKGIYKNITDSDITITELAFYKDVNGGGNMDFTNATAQIKMMMTAYEMLETPIVVPAGHYFTVEMTITNNVT